MPDVLCVYQDAYIHQLDNADHSMEETIMEELAVCAPS